MEKRGGKTTASRVPNHCDTSSAALTCDRTAENPEKKPLQAEEKKEGKSGRWRWWTSERPAAAPKKKNFSSSVPTMETTQWRAGQFSGPAVKKTQAPYSFLCRPSASLLNAKNKGRVERSSPTAADEAGRSRLKEDGAAARENSERGAAIDSPGAAGNGWNLLFRHRRR